MVLGSSEVELHSSSREWDGSNSRRGVSIPEQPGVCWSQQSASDRCHIYAIIYMLCMWFIIRTQGIN